MSIRVIETPREHLKASRDHMDKITSLLGTLSPLPIAYFSYIRTYSGGVTVGIYSETEGLQKVLESGVYSPFFDKDGSMLPDGFYFSNDVPQLLATQKDAGSMVHYLETVRGIAKDVKASWDDGFFIVKKNPLYHETFYFYSNIPSDLHKVFYLNHADVLNEFCFYFLSEAQDIIDDAMICAYKYPVVPSSKEKNKAEEVFSDLHHKNIRDRINVNKYVFICGEKEVTLTKKEFLCLEFVVKGEKPSQVAPSLDVSIKGYESIIQRVKNKFHVSDKKELYKIYYNSIYAK